MDDMRRAIASLDAADGNFGPQHEDDHDFTLLFEHTILTLLPSLAFLIIALFYIRFYLRKPVVVGRGALYVAKATSSGVLIALEIVSVVLWSSYKLHSGVSLVAAVVSLLSAFAVAGLLTTEHRHSLRPSVLASIYLTIAVILDVVKIRSYFFRHGLHAIAAVLCAAAASKLFILFLSEKSKRTQILDLEVRKSVGKEALSGFWNRSLFVWLNSTLFLGFWKVISVDSLDDLGPDFSSEHLSVKFQETWRKIDKTSRHCLLRASLWSLRHPFFIILPARLCHITFAFTQPYLLKRVLGYTDSQNTSSTERNALIIATALLYGSLLVSKAWDSQKSNHAITYLRGMLVTAVAEKTLTLESDKVKESAAITAMSTDVDGITDGARLFVDILACSIESSVGLALLSLSVKQAAFLVIVPPIVIMIATYRTVKAVPGARISWNKKIESRVAATSNIIAQIKAIKMAGLEEEMGQYLQRLREVEVEESKEFRRLCATLTSTALLSYCLTPIGVIAGGLFWTSFRHYMTPSKVFGTLAIVGLVAFPIGRLLANYPRIGAAVGCFLRLQEYLLLPERLEKRRIINGSSGQRPEALQLTEKRGDLWMPPMSEEEVMDDDAPSRMHPVEFTGVCIAPEAGQDSVVNEATFRILREKLNVITGATGSGKSLLLRSMLGEAHITRGAVELEHESIAYCGQTTWVQNESIRDNILGGRPEDAELYRTVVHACCLQHDFQSLSDGDRTLAGSGGTSLSGGQKQRISLARALYAQEEVVLLDDILSAVDHETAVVIFETLFSSDGLTRRMHQTVVLATNSDMFARAADQIICIEDGGYVTCTQNPEDAGLGSALTAEAMLRLPLAQSTQAAEEAPVDVPAEKTATKDDNDLAVRQKGDLSLYTLYFSPVLKRVLVSWAATTALYSLAERAPEIYMRVWLDVDPGNNMYFIGYALLGLVSGLCPMAMLSIFWMKLAPSSSEGLHKMLLKSTMKATLPFLTSIDIGQILNRFSQDMTLISQTLAETLWVFAYEILLTAIDVAIITSGSKYLAIAIPFIFLALYYLQLFYLRTSRQVRHLDLEAKSPLYTQFTELATGIEHIRCFGWQNRTRKDLCKRLDNSQKPFYAMFCVQRWLAVAMDMMTLILAVILVAFSMSFSGTSQSGLGLALLNLTSFSSQLMSTMIAWAGLETALGAIARLKLFMAETPTEQDERPIPPNLPLNWPDEGRVEFRHLTVGYGESLDNNSTKVIENFSLKIKGGRKVGIIGRTGSGKSTLFLTLLNFLSYRGSIIVDGFEISDIPRNVLRSRITTIPQDFIQYPGSVRNNIVPQDIMKAKETSVRDATIMQILEQVGSGIREEILINGGLDGSFAALGLSGGQKQLFSVARAIIDNIIKSTKLILVDEATSSVDGATDEKIQALMRRFFRGCTVMVISHRAESLRDAVAVYSIGKNVSYE